MKPASLIAAAGMIAAVLFAVSAEAQTAVRSIDAIDNDISYAQDERAFLQEQFDDTSVLYLASWSPNIALPIRRDRLDRIIEKTIFKPGTSARGIMSDLLRGDREYRRELLNRINELNERIAVLGEEADLATGVATLSEQEYIDQLAFDRYGESAAGSGVLRARIVEIQSLGRMSGRDMYTVHLELSNHGAGTVSFRSGKFDYTVYDPPGSKMNEQIISYRKSDLGPGDVTRLGNSCEAPPPGFQGSWSAGGTAVDTRTGQTHRWQISGTCP